MDTRGSLPQLLSLPVVAFQILAGFFLLQVPLSSASRARHPRALLTACVAVGDGSCPSATSLI